MDLSISNSDDLDLPTILNASFSTTVDSSFGLPSDLGQSSQETVGAVTSNELNVMFSHCLNIVAYANRIQN